VATDAGLPLEAAGAYGTVTFSISAFATVFVVVY